MTDATILLLYMCVLSVHYESFIFGLFAVIILLHVYSSFTLSERNWMNIK